MAKSTVLVSDKTGAIINGDGVTVSIKAPKGFWVADLTAEEGATLVTELNARAQKKRGRQPKAPALEDGFETEAVS